MLTAESRLSYGLLLLGLRCYLELVTIAAQPGLDPNVFRGCVSAAGGLLALSAINSPARWGAAWFAGCGGLFVALDFGRYHRWW